MTNNLELAFAAFKATNEAFQGDNEERKESQREELRARMRVLTSDEWEIYVEKTSEYMERHFEGK